MSTDTYYNNMLQLEVLHKKEEEEPPNEFSSEIVFNESYSQIIEQEEDSDGVDTNIKEEEKITINQAIMTITKLNLGSTILCIPFILNSLGLIFGFSFLIINAIIGVLVVDSLLLCKDITRKYGYSIFGKITMGSVGTILVKITILISNFGCSCVYTKLFGNYFSSTISVLNKNLSEKSPFRQPNIYIVLAFIALLPFIIKENTAITNKIAMFGIIGLSIFLIVLIIIFFRKLIYRELLLNTEMLFPNKKINLLDKILCLPTIIFAFSFHYSTFPIYLKLKNRTNKSMLFVTSVSLIISFLFFSGIGLLAFIMYNKTGLSEILIVNMTSDIDRMVNQNINKNIFIICLYVTSIFAFIFSCLLSVPIVFHSANKHYLNLILYMKKKSFKHFHINDSISPFEKFLYPLIAYIVILVICLSVKNIMVLFNFIGASASTMISFILPGLFTVILLNSNKIEKGKIQAYGLIFFGIIGILSFYIPQIIKIFTNNNE